jgi:hypothetical protein
MVLKILLLILQIICRISDFEPSLLSGKLVIVTNGFCNDECMDVLRRIKRITKEFYYADISIDKSAKKYMELIGYDYKYPVYFYKQQFIPDLAEDPEISSILNQL